MVRYESKAVRERRAVLQALLVVSARGDGSRFFDSIGVTFDGGRVLADHVQDWANEVRDAVVRTYADACKVKAFSVERADEGGYRLIRLGAGEGGSGHLYHGETFATADLFWSAMRTVADLYEHPACKVEER